MRKQFGRQCVWGAILLLLLAWQAVAATDLVVIVHPTNPLTTIARDELSSIYLGRNRRFPGTDVKPDPVDRNEGNAEFREFAERIHGKSLNELKAYWAKQIFSGKGSPPRRLESDAEAVAYVAAHPEAVAYVDRSAVDGRVKTVELGD